MCIAAPMALMAIGTAVSVAGQISSASAAGRASAATAQYNNETRLLQGAAIKEKAESEVGKSWDQFVRVQGAAVNTASQSGFSTESFADIFADNSAEAAFERYAIRKSAANEIMFLNRAGQADINRVNAENKARYSSLGFDIASTIIGGAGKMYGMSVKSGDTPFSLR